jgi:hypothetical protein
MASLHVRCTVTKNSGDKDATAYLGNIMFQQGGGSANTLNTETLDGLHWLVTCYSDPGLLIKGETAGGRKGCGRESAPCPTGSAILFAADSTDSLYADVTPVPTFYPNGIIQVRMVMPPSDVQDPMVNAYKVYRCPDGTKPTLLGRYGLIGQVNIDWNVTTQEYTDNFNLWTKDDVAQPTLPSYYVGQGDLAQFFPWNELPPLAVAQCVFRGSRIFVKRGDPDVYFTHPNDWEAVPAFYNIHGRSPRNDQPETVAALQQSWFIFYPDYTRHVQGLPLASDGQFDATAYEEANVDRGASGPNAVCTITKDSEAGQAVLFCVDALGFYIRDEQNFAIWSKNIIWTDTETPANGLAKPDATSLREVVVQHNAKMERVEIFYIPSSASDADTFHRLDVYYTRMRPDGQPTILGPHNPNGYARVAYGRDAAGIRRAWALNAKGVTLKLSGEGILDDGGTSPVVREVETGYFTIGGEPNTEAYIKYVDLLMGAGDGLLYTEWTLARNGYEESYSPITFNPAAPARVGIWSKGEFMSVYVGDSSGNTSQSDLAEILGLGIYPHQGSEGPTSAHRAALSKNFNTRTKQTGF